MNQTITKAKQDVRNARKAPEDHIGTYNAEYAKYLLDVKTVLVERHGTSSPEVCDFTARTGRWSNNKLAQRFASLFLAHGRQKTQNLALTNQTLDTALAYAAAIGIPNRPDQETLFESDSEDGVTSQYGQGLIESVNRKRIRDWRNHTMSRRALSTEEAHFAFEGAVVDIGDSASAMEGNEGKKRNILAANYRRLAERPVKRQRHSV